MEPLKRASTPVFSIGARLFWGFQVPWIILSRLGPFGGSVQAANTSEIEPSQAGSRLSLVGLEKLEPSLARLSSELLPESGSWLGSSGSRLGSSGSMLGSSDSRLGSRASGHSPAWQPTTSTSTRAMSIATGKSPDPYLTRAPSLDLASPLHSPSTQAASRCHQPPLEPSSASAAALDGRGGASPWTGGGPVLASRRQPCGICTLAD
jgi:hypothetical protein